MKAFVLVLFFIFSCASLIYAQTDSLQVAKKRPPRKVKGYVAGVFERAPVAPGYTNSYGVQAAVILMHHMEVGFFGSKYTDDGYRQLLIFPNKFQMNYKQAGVLLGYRTHLEKKYEFNVESKLGFGEVRWLQVERNTAFMADKFQMLHLQGGMDYMLVDFLAFNAFVGYRWMNDLDIDGLSNLDFKGLYCGIGLKVGLFK
ncbi:hypothetical protein N7E81_18260 [Reichenbachiella carrageenanivorans]|uniref:Outer membrane protein beta-barrel domain-containing protein n=1 Tax=Reichenbachiella carrageenanivorans TaxID=2979869 RepID=A0ABY6CZG2_9BACT|nr:hypothetical protein [Reichenbachiella carrageenanivorans]UXX79300.1 hypothetical protein N7E81_18260 [Reichenbachiella carrageenanivorans]